MTYLLIFAALWIVAYAWNKLMDTFRNKAQAKRDEISDVDFQKHMRYLADNGRLKDAVEFKRKLGDLRGEARIQELQRLVRSRYQGDTIVGQARDVLIEAHEKADVA